MLTFGKFTTELGDGVDRRVYFTGELALGACKGRNNFHQRWLADNHEIDIALGRLRSGCHGAINERELDRAA